MFAARSYYKGPVFYYPIPISHTINLTPLDVRGLRVLRSIGGLVVDMEVERGVPIELEVYDVTDRKVFKKSMIVSGRRFEWFGEDMKGKK